MKKILYTSMFAACAAMGLSSCMNGDYDANPATTNSASNPLNTGGSGGSGGGGGSNNPGVATKGQIRFNVNGENLTFSGTGTHYMELTSSSRLISGGKIDGTNDYTINLRIDDYTGAGTYTFGAATSTSGNRATYSKTPLGSPDDDYLTSGGSEAGSGEIKVTSDANDEMIGTFSFVAYTAGGAKATVVNGSFDVMKF